MLHNYVINWSVPTYIISVGDVWDKFQLVFDLNTLPHESVFVQNICNDLSIILLRNDSHYFLLPPLGHLILDLPQGPNKLEIIPATCFGNMDSYDLLVDDDEEEEESQFVVPQKNVMIVNFLKKVSI